jgi:hypothetical protein
MGGGRGGGGTSNGRVTMLFKSMISRGIVVTLELLRNIQLLVLFLKQETYSRSIIEAPL